MAHGKQLAILEKGVEEWNQWRADTAIRPDLSMANLGKAELGGADLSRVDLRGASLLSSNLSLVNFRFADLADADLSDAQLFMAYIIEATLNGAHFRNAFLGETVLADLDLRGVRGLDSVEHVAPSSISTSTLQLSHGRIPEAFLRGCGLKDWEIAAATLHDPNLRPDEIQGIQRKLFRLRTEQPITTTSLFLSYCHRNAPFLKAVEQRLDERGIRYWRDVHDLTAGRVERQLDRGLRLNPTVLLVLSEESVESDWVEWEAARARKLEQELGRDVLCPVALDDSWKQCQWPGPLRRQIEDYHVLDFSEWEDEVVMDRQFAKLVDGLARFYERS